MIYALILNIAILGLIAFVIWLTANPLALIGIVFLKEMPFGLLVPPDSDIDEQGRPIGFIHHED